MLRYNLVLSVREWNDGNPEEDFPATNDELIEIQDSVQDLVEDMIITLDNDREFLVSVTNFSHQS